MALRGLTSANALILNKRKNSNKFTSIERNDVEYQQQKTTGMLFIAQIHKMNGKIYSYSNECTVLTGTPEEVKTFLTAPVSSLAVSVIVERA